MVYILLQTCSFQNVSFSLVNLLCFSKLSVIHNVCKFVFHYTLYISIMKHFQSNLYSKTFNPLICSDVKLSGYSISNSIIKFPKFEVFSLEIPIFGITRFE